jgi:hypothetical protein
MNLTSTSSVAQPEQAVSARPPQRRAELVHALNEVKQELKALAKSVRHAPVQPATDTELEFIRQSDGSPFSTLHQAIRDYQSLRRHMLQGDTQAWQEDLAKLQKDLQNLAKPSEPPVPVEETAEEVPAEQEASEAEPVQVSEVVGETEPAPGAEPVVDPAPSSGNTTAAGQVYSVNVAAFSLSAASAKNGQVSLMSFQAVSLSATAQLNLLA